MNYRRIFAWLIAAVPMGWFGWTMVRSIGRDPSAIIAYGCAFLILGLPLVILSTPRGRSIAQARPQLFWLVGGGMLAIATLAIGVFIGLAMRYPSLPIIDSTIFGHCFVLLFGAGFMILATPTIFAVSRAMKRTKEDR